MIDVKWIISNFSQHDRCLNSILIHTRFVFWNSSNNGEFCRRQRWLWRPQGIGPLKVTGWWCISFILFYSKHLGDGEREDAECFPCLTCACFFSTGWWTTINLKNQRFAFNIMHNVQSKLIEAQNISWSACLFTPASQLGHGSLPKEQRLWISKALWFYYDFWISQSRGMIYPINTHYFIGCILMRLIMKGAPHPSKTPPFSLWIWSMLHQLQWWRWKLFTPITKAAHHPGL